jgi:hypothetical protein
MVTLMERKASIRCLPYTEIIRFGANLKFYYERYIYPCLYCPLVLFCRMFKHYLDVDQTESISTKTSHYSTMTQVLHFRDVHL